MPIEKMQSQTTTYHVCGGYNLRLTDICGLSQPFAGVLGARCSPLRNGGQGEDGLADAVGCRPTLPCGLGWPALS